MTDNGARDEFEPQLLGCSPNKQMQAAHTSPAFAPGDKIVASMDELAHRQWLDYRNRQPGTCFADPSFALDLPEAYELQRAVSVLRVASGDRIIGHKVGCTGPGTVAQFGMQGPISGHLYNSEVRRSGDTLDATQFAHLAIEGEMALRIGDDKEIVAAFPVIELHNFVFRAPHRTLAELVANNGLNAGVVLPQEVLMSSQTWLAKQATLSVRINDRAVGTGDLWALPGGPGASLDWLRGHLAAAGLVLTPDQIVLAGTPLGLYPVEPGDHVAVFIDNEPMVHCSIG